MSRAAARGKRPRDVEDDVQPCKDVVCAPINGAYPVILWRPPQTFYVRSRRNFQKGDIVLSSPEFSHWVEEGCEECNAPKMDFWANNAELDPKLPEWAKSQYSDHFCESNRWSPKTHNEWPPYLHEMMDKFLRKHVRTTCEYHNLPEELTFFKVEKFTEMVRRHLIEERPPIGQLKHYWLHGYQTDLILLFIALRVGIVSARQTEFLIFVRKRARLLFLYKRDYSFT